MKRGGGGGADAIHKYGAAWNLQIRNLPSELNVDERFMNSALVSTNGFQTRESVLRIILIFECIQV